MNSSTPSYSWNWSSIFQSGEQRCNLLVSTSWHSGVAPCMHGALSTQKLELHAIQLWGCTAQNKELSGFCFEQVAPGPAVFGETQIRYLQAKKQWAQANYSVLFCSVLHRSSFISAADLVLSKETADQPWKSCVSSCIVAFSPLIRLIILRLRNVASLCLLSIDAGKCQCTWLVMNESADQMAWQSL